MRKRNPTHLTNICLHNITHHVQVTLCARPTVRSAAMCTEEDALEIGFQTLTPASPQRLLATCKAELLPTRRMANWLLKLLLFQ